MKGSALRVLLFLGVVILSGCATVGQNIAMDADRTADQFFHQLQRSKRPEAYKLLSWQLTQNISYEQFEGLMDVLQSNWGRIESVQTILMPFHERPGEEAFVSSSLPQDQVKRFVFEIQFEEALMNCDLTLARQAGEYKIYWLSFWGSSVYMKPEIQKKMQELFSNVQEA